MPLPMTVQFDDIVFPYVYYDERYDDLSLRMTPEPQHVDWYAPHDGAYSVKYDSNGNVVGLFIEAAKRKIERIGDITITLPDGHVMRSPDVAEFLRRQTTTAR